MCIWAGALIFVIWMVWTEPGLNHRDKKKDKEKWEIAYDDYVKGI